MRTGLFTHIGPRLVACALLVAGSVAAFARSVDEVLPGQKLFGELPRGGELTVVVRVVDGTVLNVSAKAWKGSDLRPLLSLRDEDGDAVLLLDHLKASKKGNKVAVKQLALDAGAYQLTVEGDFGTAGGFDLVTSASLPSRLKGELNVAAPGTPAYLLFDGLPGDVVQLKIGADKKSGLSPVIERMVAPDGSETVVDETKKSPKLDITQVGKHRFEIGGLDGTTGIVKYVLKIKRAKAPKERRDLAELNARGNVTGRIVLDGDVSRDAGAAKVAAAAPGPRSDTGSVVAGQVIIAPVSGASRELVLQAVAEEVPGLNAEVAAELTPQGPWLLRVPSLSQDTPDQRRRLQTLTISEACARSPLLAFAEVNRRIGVCKTPNDLHYSQQTDMGQMNLPKAWDLQTGDPSVVIAIVDSGIWPHPDLQSKVLPGYDFVSDLTSAQDGNGVDNDPTDSSRVFHGTHVAGTAAAATGNGIGVAGVAWGCKLLPVRVLGKDGYGTHFDIAKGILWAVGASVSGAPNNPNPARVVNMSIGGSASSSTLQSAVSQAHALGAVLVAASGNSGSASPEYPAAYSDVISVYALDANFHWTSYTNWGPSITVGAPGGDLNAGLPGILSTYVDTSLQPTYAQLQGTSMASPHVAGVAALLLSSAPSLTPDEVEQILIDTAIDLGPTGFDVDYGWGAVDAFAALREVEGPPTAPPTLRFWPSLLEFGRLTDSRPIYVSNEGSGTVTINTVSATTTDGAPWLTVSVASATVPTTIDVHVDHDQLFDGTFEGMVVVDTSVGQATVPVRVTRVPAPSLDVVRVKALGPDGRVLATTTTSAALGWEYTLADLPLGSYTIAAEADLDADFQLTRIDEFEGRWPLLDRPRPLDVSTAELDYADIDVPLLRRDAQYQFDGVGGGLIDGAIAVRVFDARDGTPIVGAAAFLGDGLVAAETDLNGRAVLVGQFTGGQVVSVAADGYVTRTRIGANGQYQSFAMEPRSVPETVHVAAHVSGLPAQSATVIVHVGTTRAAADWNGETSQTVELDVPRRRPGEAVSAVVLDADGKPVAVALDNILLVGTTDTDIDLAVAPPSGGARGRIVEAMLPSSAFTQSGASLETLVTVRLDRDRWVPIGWSPVPVNDPTTVWWANLLDFDPPLPMRFETTSVDVSDRVSQRAFVGDTATIPVERPMSLPVPGTPQSPKGGAMVSRFGLQLQLSASGGENVVEAVVEDASGVPVWRIVKEGPASSVTLPDIPFGGLAAGTDYAWYVELRTVPGLVFGSHDEDDLRLETTTFTRSGKAQFHTD